jgi:hypothetical protein
MSKLLGRFGNSNYAKNLATGDINSYKRQWASTPYENPGPNSIFHRFVVLDVINDPASIVNNEDFEKKLQYWRSIDVSNLGLARVLPRNTIIGKRINDSESSQVENPMFLFPFFPSHLALPCKPGEHVWVMFETFRNQGTGYWFGKITEISHVDDVNHTHSPRAYEESFFLGSKDKSEGKTTDYHFRVGRTIVKDNDKTTSADSAIVDSDDEKFYEKLLTESDASQIMTYEPIPRFKKRPGDVVIEGSNNSLIVLGTDRVGPYADVKKSSNGNVPNKSQVDLDGNSGSVDIVAGRGQTPATSGVTVDSKSIDGTNFKKELGKSESELTPNEGDPDWVNDKSRVLVSQRTKVDTNLQIANINQEFGVSDGEGGDAAVLLKSDKVRILGRKDTQILVKDDSGKDVTTVVAKSNGEITIKAKKTSIKIDPEGNITLDAEGVVKLGGQNAETPCARKTDKVLIDPGFQQWIQQTVIAINAKMPTPAGGPPATPLNGVIGTINEGSDKVLVVK